jgi:hypothetical protein
MKRIKHFDPLSVMKISAIWHGGLGLFEGLFFGIFVSISGLVDGGHHWLPFLFGGLSIVLFPILFAALGAAFGGLGAVIYNVSAKYVGGIRVEVEEEPAPTAGSL